MTISALRYILYTRYNKLLVDCVWAAWQIGECSTTCSDGTRTKLRLKSIEEREGGVCLGESSIQEIYGNPKCSGSSSLYIFYFMTDVAIQFN